MKKSGLLASFALAAAFVLSGCTTASRIGGQTPDGVYAGISPDTKKPMYTTAADAPGSPYTFDSAIAYCAALEPRGHHDFHAPRKGELNVLFKNRAAIGGFNEPGSNPAGRYWSSSPYYYGGWAQSFSDGQQSYISRDLPSSLRCVR